MKISFFLVCCVITPVLMSAGKADRTIQRGGAGFEPIVYDAGAEELILEEGKSSQQNLEPFTTPELTVSRAEQVMKALALAYPRRVREVTQRDGDWAVLVRGQWFYYADGRLLPEHLRTLSSNFSPQPFYNYPEKLPAWRRPKPDEAARLAEAAQRRQSGQTANRSLFFYDTLWDIRNRAEAWEHMKTIKFLGKSILVHRGIMEELALIEQKINEEAKRNPKINTWLRGINSISAWNWRNIADVKTRSNHAYGVALDVLPQPNVYRALETYWLWTAQKNAEWWNIPYSRRYHPPEAVIRAFESYGFVWGGKWSFYDTMHFEYRPEILIINGIKITGEY